MNKRKKVLTVTFIFLLALSFCFVAQRVGDDSKIQGSITVLNNEVQTESKITNQYTKIYEEETKTITLTDKTTEETKATIKLETPLIFEVIRGKNRKVAEFTFTNYDKEQDFNKIFNGMEFYDTKRNMLNVNREFTYKKKSLIPYEVDIFIDKCTDTGLENGSLTCIKVKSGTETKYKPDWKTINSFDEVPLGEITIGIFTDVKAGDRIDWVPTILGVEVEEFAVWVESYNVGLLAYFNFDEETGNQLPDATGQIVNSTVSGSTNWTTGDSAKLGGALNFDGTDDFVTITGIRSLGTTTQGWAFALWVFQPNTGEIIIARANDGGVNREMRLRRSGAGTIQGYVFDAANAYKGTDGTYTLNEWNFLVFSYNGTGTNLYKNGLLEDSEYVGEVKRIDSDTYLGTAWDGASDGAGIMDELGVWNRSLSQTEVTNLYNGGAAMTWTDDFNTAPTAPVWNAPATNGTTINAVNYYVNWTNSTDGEGDPLIYKLDIATDNDFATIVYSNSSITETATPTSYWVTGLADDTYYSRIRANDGSVNSSWSTTYWTQEAGIGVTPVTPTNNTYYITSDNTFNCSSNSSLNVETLTLDINGIWNYSLIHGTSTDVSFEINRTLTDGTHNYSCTANNTITSATTNLITFTIDSTEPVINLTNYPGSPNVTSNNPQNFTFNWTVTDDTTSSSWVEYNNTNYTGIIVGTDYGINFGINNGSNTIKIYANDSVGNEVYKTVNITVYWLNITTQHTAETYETSIDNFNLTLDIPAIYTFSSANIVYNGTTYTSTTSTTNGKLLIKNNINIPLTPNAGNKSFYWNISFIETNLITDTYSHLVSKTVAINITENCSAGLTKVFNFDFKTETNLTSINADTVDYLFKYGLGGNSTGFEIYGTLTNITTLAVCLNSSYPYYTVGYGELKYKSDGYTDRSYYIFQNTRSTIPAINITLYYLQNAIATSFQVVAESTTLDPYEDKYIQLLRWYPNLNTYNVVEMGETDETGSTVVRVKSEDVDYRIGLYELNGSLIKLAEPIRMVCLTSPCEYTLRVSPADTDYTSFLGVESSLEYDEDTEIWLYTYNDPSQTTSEMELTIYKDTGTSRIEICSSTGTGSVGAISCDTTSYVGTLRGEVVRSASPGVVIAQKIVQIGDNAFKSKWGLWLSFLLAIPIMLFLGTISPVAAVIGGVIALIPAFYLGSISITILGGILILGGLVIHFIKRIN